MSLPVSNFRHLLTQVQITSYAVTQVPTLRRKRLSLYDADPLELILVVPGTESEGMGDYEGGLVVTYPVLVVISQPLGNLINSDSEDRMLDLRSALHYHLRSVNIAQFANAEILQAECNFQPQFDRSAARDNRDLSGLEFTYTIRQQQKV